MRNSAVLLVEYPISKESDEKSKVTAKGVNMNNKSLIDEKIKEKYQEIKNETDYLTKDFLLNKFEAYLEGVIDERKRQENSNE